MNILVSNDDGINAIGIKKLVEALSKVSNVYVSAPHTQRSANSHAITLEQMVSVKNVDFSFAEEALEVSGTPADCVKMGLQLFRERGIIMDMVFSGINLGSNLGRDTLYSGTVGAAMEASLSGVKAVAVSVDSHKATHFDAACQLAVDVIPMVKKDIEVDTVININVPNLPKEEIKGVKFTALGDRYYSDRFHLIEESDGIKKYKLAGEPADFSNAPQCFDVTAAHYNYASITPLHYDLTSYRIVDQVKKWNIEIK